MNTKPINFVLIGRSGCGKGTQAKLLMEHFGNLFYISTGDLFRDLAKQETDTALKIKEVIEGGGLPFDDLAVCLWMHKISYEVKREQGILIDGAPRRLMEAKALDNFYEFLGRKENTKIILVDISRDEAFLRLTKRRICMQCGQLIPWVGDYKKLENCDKCGGVLEIRPDDTLEAINSRLDYFDQRVVEVIDYFEKQCRLLRVNGEQPIVKVFDDILAEIRKK